MTMFFCMNSAMHLPGLGDEYFSSPVAYEDYFTPGVEPLDPNITILLDTANVKWKQYLVAGDQSSYRMGKAYIRQPE